MIEEPLRVVIADDYADVRDYVRMTLEADGRFEVVAEAKDGVEALKLITAEQPDAVVIDLMMPGGDGVDVLPQIAACSPHTKVLALSGVENNLIESAVRARGAHGYMDKARIKKHLVSSLYDLCQESERAH